MFVPRTDRTMRTYRDAKIMAKTLRRGLSERQIDLSHSACLELVARQLGVADWNTLSAAIGRNPEAPTLRMPDGWFPAGSNPTDYDMGVDEGNDNHAALIRYKYAVDDTAEARRPNGFGTLMQTILADAYRGKRIMLSAQLRTEEVDGAATIWMRIDGQERPSLRFDNMESRASEGVLRGTEDWTGRHIVLDVPDNSTTIAFGFYLRGSGCALARDFVLVEVAGDVAVTARFGSDRSNPFNLDFSKRSKPAS